MSLVTVGAFGGLIAASGAVFGVCWQVWSSFKAGVAEDARALEVKYQDGIVEGLRRAQSTIDLRTSERDQARLDLANYMMANNDNQNPRRGGERR